MLYQPWFICMQRSAATMRRTLKGKGPAATPSSVWYGPDRPLFLGPFSEAAVPTYLDGANLPPYPIRFLEFQTLQHWHPP